MIPLLSGGQEIIMRYYIDVLNLNISNKKFIKRCASDLKKYETFRKIEPKADNSELIKKILKNKSIFCETKSMDINQIKCSYLSLIDILNNQIFDIYSSDDSILKVRIFTRVIFPRKEINQLFVLKKFFLSLHKKLFCEVCKFSFSDKYGSRGNEFIEVHHTTPISNSNSDGDYICLDDLVLLCSNCHSMIHSKQPWLSIKDLDFNREEC